MGIFDSLCIAPIDAPAFRQPHRGCFVAASCTSFVLQHYSINRRSCKSSLASLRLLSVESSFGSFNCFRSGGLFCLRDSMSRRAGGDNLNLCHWFESCLRRQKGRNLFFVLFLSNPKDWYVITRKRVCNRRRRMASDFSD